MIVCPNCNHQNPDGAVQCEACYTPLPAMTTCPNCGAMVQTDASFCGQCGFNLRASGAVVTPAEAVLSSSPAIGANSALPDQVAPGQIGPLEPLIASAAEPPPDLLPMPPLVEKPVSPRAVASDPKTQLQQQSAQLLHVQTNNTIELPSNLSVIHLGKPNDRIPPDIDVSGFPNSEIVSRIHADIRMEGDAFYIEDVGSSNGTYINNAPLSMGNRHRLRTGDRIALGKGDKVSFLFILT